MKRIKNKVKVVGQTALAPTPGSEEIGAVYALNNKRYLCRKLLGSGGYAFVYLVESESIPGNFFALKRLLVNSERLEAAKKEIAIWASLPQHPNVGMLFFFLFSFFFSFSFFTHQPTLTKQHLSPSLSPSLSVLLVFLLLIPYLI